MPGTPATSPRFDIPRYDDGDDAAFSDQVNGITDGFDDAVGRRWTPVVVATTHTTADHEVVAGLGGAVITLPTPTAEMEQIRIFGGDDAVSSTSPVTIHAASGDGIIGKGLDPAGVASIVLGTPGAFVLLQSFDNSNWQIIAGMMDSGWVPITPGAGVSAPGASGLAAASRQLGDRVDFRGSLHAIGLSLGAQLGTLGSAAHEAGGITRTSLAGTSGSYPVRFQGTNPAIFVDAACTDTNVCFDGYFYYL